MNCSSRIAGTLLGSMLLRGAGAAGIVCHIHLPAEHPAAGGKPAIIQNVGDQWRCERVNNERYGGLGRCHCAFGTGRSDDDRPAPPAGPPPTLP
jgi:hypothetical protein